MLRIENLIKTFEGEREKKRKNQPTARVRAIDDVSFEVTDGQMFTLLGPSGCGKTTTLRSVAGLEHPDAGTIRLDDGILFSRIAGQVTNVPPNQRGLGMVFQSYAIWPHMQVFDNVAFPLQVRRRSQRLNKKEIRDKVTRVLETMELDHLADRQATKLSGGQQQRLALARAIITEPPLMLLDEPLSNLDAKLRESLRFELKRLQRELGLTSIYVTHDQTEALALSSVVAVMCDGKIIQIGKPRDIYANPNCQFVAEFIGTSNFLPGVVSGTTGTHTKIETSEGVLWSDTGSKLAAGTEVLISLRPENIRISTEQSAGIVPNEWRGSVTTRAFLGDTIDHVAEVGKHELRVRSNPAVSIPPGTEIYLTISPENVTLLPS